MIEGIKSYFQFFFQNNFYRILLAVFAYTFLLTPPSHIKEFKSWLFYSLRFLGVMAAVILVGALLSGIIIGFSLDVFWNLIADLIAYTIVFVPYGVIFCRYSKKQKLIYILTSFAVLTPVIYLCYSIWWSVENTNTLSTILILIAIYSIFVIFSLVSRRFSLNRFVYIPKGLILFAVLVDISVMILTISTLCLDRMAFFTSIFSCLLYSIELILVISMYFSIFAICSERKNYERAVAENSYIKADNEQIQLVKSNLSELKKIRHDIRNQIGLISVYLENKDYDKLSEAFALLSQIKLKPDFYVDCGNRELSAILTMEATKAHEKDFVLDCAVMVPNKLPFDDISICALLTNLIDNAIEANARYKINDPIQVKIMIRQEYLYFSVTNTLPKERNDKEILSLKTSKTGEHGIGSGIVAKIAEQYKGYVNYDIQNDQFIAEAVLDMFFNKEEKENA